MKLKASKKDIRNKAHQIVAIGYCDAQTLLKYSSPFAYSAGVYGWACDYYQFGGLVISTGYSPIGKYADYKLVREYEDKALNAKNAAELETILAEFIEKIKGA